MISREEIIKIEKEASKGICKECNVKMIHYRHLVDHMWVHHEICPVCGKITNFKRYHEDVGIQSMIDMAIAREIATQWISAQ